MVGDFQSSVVAFAVPLGLHEEQIAALSEEDRGCHLSLRKSGGRWESISQSVLMFLEWSSANCYVVAFRDDEVLRLAYIAMLWLRAQAATVGHAVVYGLREVGAGFRSKEALTYVKAWQGPVTCGRGCRVGTLILTASRVNLLPTLSLQINSTCCHSFASRMLC